MSRRRRPPALRLLRLANPVVRLVLRSRAHRLLSGSLLLLVYRGRRSGRTFTIPVMYAPDGERVVVVAATAERKLWWRSVGAGAEVAVLLRGERLQGTARVLEAPEERREAVAAYVRRFPRSAGHVERGAESVAVVELALHGRR